MSEGASARGDVTRISPGIGRGQWSLPLTPPLKSGEEDGIASLLESMYRPGTLTMLECRFNKTTHHVIIIFGSFLTDGLYPLGLSRLVDLGLYD